MTAPYAIAKYLPSAAIAAALAHTYDHRSPLLVAPRDAEGCCPLGRAMAALWPYADFVPPKVPQAVQVAVVLKQYRDMDDATFEVVWAAARVFMEDWDRGALT